MSRVAALQALLSDLGAFSKALYPQAPLRPYQLAAAGPILAAVDARRGGGYTLLFARQSGKDELLAQLLAFLLARYRRRGGGIVMATPTYKPQALVSRRRLIARTATPLHVGGHGADGYRFQVGQAGVAFLSAEPGANVRGETADCLLVANEAQDIEPSIWDARFAPMAASTNAPSVYSGTPWAAGSLLSRQLYDAEASGTLYRADWQEVAAAVPAYGEHVRERVALLGINHPFIRTEYFLEELDAAGGLFGPERQAQMRGAHLSRSSAEAGRRYALLLDVGGADEDQPEELGRLGREKRRDSTALTVVEVDDRAVRDPLVRRPAYRVVHRRLWTGRKHRELLPLLADLAADVWHARWFVVDATGIGAGLAEFLGATLGSRCQVIPFIFSQASKSKLGWDFLGAIESGRYKEYADDGMSATRQFWQEVGACTYSVDPGPGKLMRWSVPESKGHDDLLVSAALVGVLESLEWAPRQATGRTRADWGVAA